MNITIAIVFVNGTATTRIESECLVKCAGIENYDGGGRDIDEHRRILEQAFTEIHASREIEVLFPELGECIDHDTN